jgi:hypothetical protein
MQFKAMGWSKRQGYNEAYTAFVFSGEMSGNVRSDIIQ